MSTEHRHDNNGAWKITFLEEVANLKDYGGMAVWDPVRNTEALVVSTNNHLEIITGRGHEHYEITIEEASVYRLQFLSRLFPPLVAG